MPTPTYDLIASNVLTSSASSVTFSGISGSYRDLVLVMEVLGSAFIEPQIRFNSDTGSNYLSVSMTGNGSTASSSSGTDASIFGLTSANATTRGVNRLQIMDYSATDKHKTVLHRGDRSDLHTRATAYRWASTSAITAIEMYVTSGNFASGSSFYLYGIVS